MISDEDMIQYENMQRQDKEHVHGQLAVEVARIKGILPNQDATWKVYDEENVSAADNNVDIKLDRWRQELEHFSVVQSEVDVEKNEDRPTTNAEVLPLSDLWRLVC